MTKETLCGFAVGDRVVINDSHSWIGITGVVVGLKGTIIQVVCDPGQTYSGCIAGQPINPIYCEGGEPGHSDWYEDSLTLVTAEPTDKELADQYRDLLEQAVAARLTLEGRGYEISNTNHNLALVYVEPRSWIFRKTRTEEV